jgi:hypothetical protein
VLASDPFTLDEAVAAARRYGLVKATERTLVMHRLVQQVIRHRLDSVTKAARAAIAVRLIRAAFPTEHTDPDAWPVHAWLLPHVLAVTGHAEALAIEPEATAWLLTQAGLYLWHRADYQQARSLLERAWPSTKPTLAPTPPPRASSTTSPTSWMPKATCPPPAPCWSAPWPSPRPAWAPTTPTRCKAGRTLRQWWRSWTLHSNRLYGIAVRSVLG